MKKLLLAFSVLALTACLGNDDPYSAGFVVYQPNSLVSYSYANNTGDVLTFYSYGNWRLAPDASFGASWISVSQTSGAGNAYYRLPLTFQQNTSGQGRGARFNLTDTDLPGDASAAVYYWQYATRGDGSLGSAPDVKAISGTDGSRIDIAYDELHRPVSLHISSADLQIDRTLTLRYNDTDSLLTVTDDQRRLTAFYDRDFQPQRLHGETDTVGYFAQYSNLGIQLPANYAFNVEHHSSAVGTIGYAYSLNGASLSPDSLHCADSLRIVRLSPTGTAQPVIGVKFSYTDADNRCQSVDVNQLLLGLDLCDPYQLLGLFRFSRSTSIVGEAEVSGSTRIRVDHQLNADRSVHTLTVIRHGSTTTADEVTYTFTY